MRFAARSAVFLAVACFALAAVGCGSQGDSTPVACLGGAASYEKALREAPGEVLLEGKTPISECLAPNQQAGDLAQAGEAMVETATSLSAKARAEDGGDAAVQLGYLLGAAERGAESSEGIHADLVRRLTVAARYAPDKEPLSPAFMRSYEAGYAAGREHG